MFHISKVFLIAKNKKNSFLSYCYLFFLYQNIALHNKYYNAHSLVNIKNPFKVVVNYYPSLNKHIKKMTISDSTTVNNNPTITVENDNNNPNITVSSDNNNPTIVVDNSNYNSTTTINNNNIIKDNNNKVMFTNQGSKQKNKAKSRGQDNPDYNIVIDASGRCIRSVKPYIQEFVTFCKGRWIGREIVEILTSNK